jgi:hypothetical protein
MISVAVGPPGRAGEAGGRLEAKWLRKGSGEFDGDADEDDGADHGGHNFEKGNATMKRIVLNINNTRTYGSKHKQP